MKYEMSLCRDTEVMDAEEELAKLADPGSLPEPAKSASEVIDLLSTISEERKILQAQDTPRFSRSSRLGISLGFTSDVAAGLVSQHFFRTVNVSIPQFTAAIPPLAYYFSPLKC